MRQVKFDPKHSSQADIARIINEQTGHTVKLGQPGLEITKLRSTDEMLVQFAQFLEDIPDGRVALTH
jgi:hypothetical protein